MAEKKLGSTELSGLKFKFQRGREVRQEKRVASEKTAFDEQLSRPGVFFLIIAGSTDHR
jgi:hypothetical protein